MTIPRIFQRDYHRYEGVRPINIFLLRLLFLLVFVFVGYDSWTYLLSYEGTWDHVRAAAFCMWGSYSLLSLLGVLHPLKMLPLVMFEILYKTVWLILVAYPLWAADRLAGSPAEDMTYAFLWVILPVLAMPWKYALEKYVLSVRPQAASEAAAAVQASRATVLGS